MATQQYVIQQYRELLGRDPDAGGLKHYMGYSNPAEVRSSILGSAEYRNKQAPAPAAAAPNSSQPLIDYAAQMKKDSDALLARQKQEQEGLFGQYETKLTGQEALPALYRRLQGEAGIPELSQQAQAFKNEIFRVKGLLDRLDEDVTTRTMGTYTNEAMRRRISASEGDEMRTTLGRLGTGLEPVAEMLKSAQGDVSTMLQLNAQQQDKEMQPLVMRINALGDRFAREMTGFSNEKQASLTAILDKLERDRFLSDRDWDLAQKLAAEERDFSRQKQLVTMQIAANTSANNTTNYTPPARTTVTAPKALPADPPTQVAKNTVASVLTPLMAKPTSPIPLFNNAWKGVPFK
ncbi:hypothetical protein [Caudoviricetes sp.]|nr:hypothetical protein [Caudoviricetes sp.]